MVSAGSKLPDIGEIKILSDQETAIALGAIPDDLIGPAIDTFILNCVGFMAERNEDAHQRVGQVLIQLDLHAATGTGGNGRSSSAEEAA